MQGVHLFSGPTDELLFTKIASEIHDRGFSINPNALPLRLSEALVLELDDLDAAHFKQASIGRTNNKCLNTFVRTNEIYWITGQTQACAAWLEWIAQLQQYLNRRLFLGLNHFESHFAHYAPGHFYKRHYDTFLSGNARKVSIVIYLNQIWGPHDGGELALYFNDKDTSGLKVSPLMGSVVVFLSEDFPHEVLVSQRDRYSITGWFKTSSPSNLKAMQLL